MVVVTVINRVLRLSLPNYTAAEQMLQFTLAMKWARLLMAIVTSAVARAVTGWICTRPQIVVHAGRQTIVAKASQINPAISTGALRINRGVDWISRKRLAIIPSPILIGVDETLSPHPRRCDRTLPVEIFPHTV